MRARFLAVIAAGLPVAFGTARAQWTPATTRPLTHHELVVISAQAPIIAYARIGTYHHAYLSGPRMHDWTVLELDILRRVRGACPSHLTIPIWPENLTESPLPMYQARLVTGTSHLLFLGRDHGNWHFAGAPYLWGTIPAADTAAKWEGELLAAVPATSLATLSTHAESIVRAKWSRVGRIHRFVVEEWIAGRPLGNSGPINPVFLGRIGDDDLILLHHTQGDTLEPLAGGIGMYPIRDGIVEPLHQPLDAVIRQIREARLARSAHPEHN